MERLADFKERMRRNSKRAAFRCGDRVRDEGDERHIGTIDFIGLGIVRVRWPNGWRSDIDERNVRHAK